MTDSPIEILDGAIDVLRNFRWIKHEYAVDKDDLPTDPVDEDACGFCTIGAVFRVAGHNDTYVPPQHKEVIQALIAIADSVGGEDTPFWDWYDVMETVSIWNDAKVNSKEDVIQAMEEAKKKLKGRKAA